MKLTLREILSWMTIVVLLRFIKASIGEWKFVSWLEPDGGK